MPDVLVKLGDLWIVLVVYYRVFVHDSGAKKHRQTLDSVLKVDGLETTKVTCECDFCAAA